MTDPVGRVASGAAFFDRLDWHDDRVLLDGWVYRLEHTRDDTTWDLGDDCFRFFKIEPLVDQYRRFLATRPGFRPERIFELGIWDGGSVAFWFELFGPMHHVAVDIEVREDSAYFRRWRDARAGSARVQTHWSTDQADRPRLEQLVASFDGPLDLVVDDASHLYGPTRASFETLFPHLRPGGLYLIEDWAWGHWPEFFADDHPWAAETPPTRLVTELVEAAGTSERWVAGVTVHQGFVVVERGDAPIDSSEPFSLDAVIERRPEPPPVPRPSPRSRRRGRFGRRQSKDT